MGPYAPAADKPLILSLAGAWSGTVRLLRSVDGGATLLPLTLGGADWGVYAANVCEPVWEETEPSAIFYRRITPTTGTVTYRMAQ